MLLITLNRSRATTHAVSLLPVWAVATWLAKCLLSVWAVAAGLTERWVHQSLMLLLVFVAPL